MSSNAAKNAYLKALADAIRDNYDCASLHIASEPVQVRIGPKLFTVQVEIFQLVNCPDGTMCFAWIHPPHGSEQHSTFAGIIAGPGCSTAKEAVHTYVAGGDEREAA